MVRCTLICCSRSAPTLLMHVNLLLIIIAGAGVATTARLKWDPSTYLIFRGFLPNVYRVLSSVLCFVSFMLIVLAHLAVIAMGIRSPKYQHWRRALFFTYSALMMILILVELGTVVWLCVKVIDWLRTGIPRKILNASMDLINAGNSILSTGGTIITTTSNVYNKAAGIFSRQKRSIDLSLIADVLKILKDSMGEMKYDLLFNFLVAFTFIALAAVLQPLAVVLGINAAFTYTKAGDTLCGGDTTKIVNYIRYNSENHKNPVQIQTVKKQKTVI